MAGFTLTSMPTANWRSVAYGNGVFVAIANGTVAGTSTDGVTWTARTLPNAAWQCVAFGNGLFVAVAYNTATYATSTNGITWTSRTLPYNQLFNSVTYGNGRFIICGDSPWTLNSTTGTSSWNLAAGSGGSYWPGVCYGTDFVGVQRTLNGVSQVSANGTSWTAYSMPDSEGWESVAYGNGVYVAISADALAAVSTDGATWSGHTCPFNLRWVAFGSGVFVAVGPGVAAVSTDGITWVESATDGPSWYRVGFGTADLFAIVPSSGTVSGIYDSTAADEFWTANVIATETF